MSHSMMRPTARFLALVLVLAAATQRADTPTASFQASSELVSVDVIVLDGHGQPVEGLTTADFTLSEDGQPQTVTTFEASALHGEMSTSVARSRVSTNAATAERSERVFVLVLDDIALTPTSIGPTRKAVSEFLTHGLREGDQVTLQPTSGRSGWTARLPEGRASLLAYLERVEGRYRPDLGRDRISDYEAIQIHLGRDKQILPEVLRRYYENGVLVEARDATQRDSMAALDISPGAGIIRAKAGAVYASLSERLQHTLGTLERVAQSLAGLRGRKTILLISEGFALDTTQPGFREVTRAAREANAVFYFVDARGLAGERAGVAAPGASAEQGRLGLEQDVLATFTDAAQEGAGAVSVAAATGGLSIRNTNNLAERMKAVADESRAYYLLGFIPSNSKHDGKFRKLKVEVKRPDVTVRARRGYYAPSDADPKPTGKGALDPRIRAALDAPVGAGDLPVRLVAHAFGPAGPGKNAVLLVAEVDAAQLSLKAGADKRYAGAVETYLVVNSAAQGEPTTQEKLVELSVPEAALPELRAKGLSIYRDLQLAPGTYQARLLVRDRESGRVGSVRHEFTVPDPSVLGTSTPILTDNLHSQPDGSLRPIPVAHRTFQTGLQLVYTYEVYGAKRDAQGDTKLTASYEVRRADGSTLTPRQARPVDAGFQGPASQMLPISLQGVPAGDYELVVTVRDDMAGRSIEISDVFSVVD